MTLMRNIIEMNYSEITELIQTKKLSVCIIGIGRIGLPTALSFANSGFSTIGVDINEKLIEMINSSNFPLKDEPGYDVIFEKVIQEKKFLATSNFSEGVNSSDVIILSLPTPMDENNVPDYSALLSVAQKLHDEMYDGKLIIVESTVEPGFVENDFLDVLEGNDKKLGTNFCIGVCPETANPGEILKDFQNLPRLVGSTDKKIVDIISSLYENVFGVELIKMPDCKTANAVKLTTNVFRDINIAFINELALLYEKLGIDIMTVLDAAKRKYNFQIHYPGAGVGGPCLPVNSYQLLNTQKKLNENFLQIVHVARQTNERMSLHVIRLLKDSFSELNENLENKTISILGISYKPNVKDIQLSPAEDIIKILLKNNKVKIYDPYFKNSPKFSVHVENNLNDALNESDAAVIITGHKEFQNIEPELFKSKLRSPVLVDCTGGIDLQKALSSGLIYRGIGRGTSHFIKK